MRLITRCTVLAEEVSIWEAKNKPYFLYEFLRSDQFNFYKHYMNRGFTRKLDEYQFLFYAARDLYLDETFKTHPRKYNIRRQRHSLAVRLSIATMR